MDARLSASATAQGRESDSERLDWLESNFEAFIGVRLREPLRGLIDNSAQDDHPPQDGREGVERG